MSRTRARMGVAAVCAAATGALLWALPVTTAVASSHREAPLITELPKSDGTDWYMFNSYEPGREGYVTMIANYLPLQAPYGGPNYFFMDPNALYEFHIDNTGDGKEDITFQFRFKNTLNDLTVSAGGKPISIPLVNIGAIAAENDPNQNISETYTLNIVRGNRRTGNRRSVGTNLTKPIDNIGVKSVPGYEAYARTFIHDFTIPGCDAGQGKVFVGQRKEPFFINLGEVFDLINLDPLGSTSGKQNILDNFNVTSLALEVPAACLTRNADATSAVIGGWTTSSLRQARTLRPRPTFARPSVEVGAWTQVSRLCMPLVNEVVIGLKDKDRFNASKPENDAQFADYVTNPSLPVLIETLFPAAVAPTQFPRTDLVAAFLTGVETVNQIRANPAPSEMLRLNTGIPATAAGAQNNLGAALCFVQGVVTLGNAGCDPAGFPNGRRPGDDVVDITLRVAMGYLLPLAAAPAGQMPFTDQATGSAALFDAQFPYLKAPLPGSPQ
ncbi:MAG: DUF4331 domain-containing protein [Nitrospiraceae bacterium]